MDTGSKNFVYTQKGYDYTSLRADILSFSCVHVVHIVTDNLRRVVVFARILTFLKPSGYFTYHQV